MFKLSDQVTRKFEESLDINDFDLEIESDTGWIPLTHFNLTEPYKIWKFVLSNGASLECADTHIVFDENFNEIYVQNLIPNETMVMTKDGPFVVVDVSCDETSNSENMFDLTVDSENHRFYTSNGILSHNTTTAAALVLWHALFTEQYTIAILANKMEQAQEIMDRVQMTYENLPMWMQQGVVVWNKRRLELENGSIIFASATSSSAIRGKSVNMVYMDEFAHIDGNLQQKFFTSTYPVISSGKKTKVIITSTPNGFEFFAKLWQDAIKADGEEGKNEYVPIDVHWSDVPGRDEDWMRSQINNTSFEQFRQEHLCVIGSTNIRVRNKQSLDEFDTTIEELVTLL